MDLNNTPHFITYSTSILMPIFMLAVLIVSFRERRSSGRGITRSFIQLVGIAWIIGATLMLAVSGHLDSHASTILGAVAGYLFGLRTVGRPAPSARTSP